MICAKKERGWAKTSFSYAPLRNHGLDSYETTELTEDTENRERRPWGGMEILPRVTDRRSVAGEPGTLSHHEDRDAHSIRRNDWSFGMTARPHFAYFLRSFSISSGASIHSSEKPHFPQRYRVTFTAENHPVGMLFPEPYAPTWPGIRITSKLAHFGHFRICFIRSTARAGQQYMDCLHLPANTRRDFHPPTVLRVFRVFRVLRELRGSIHY